MSALTKDDISDMSNEQQAKYCYWCFYKDYGNCNHCALVHLVTPNNRVQPTLLTPRPETVVTKQNILAALEAINQSIAKRLTQDR